MISKRIKIIDIKWSARADLRHWMMFAALTSKGNEGRASNRLCGRLISGPATTEASDCRSPVIGVGVAENPVWASSLLTQASCERVITTCKGLGIRSQHGFQG
jgi:hypothetical protein